MWIVWKKKTRRAFEEAEQDFVRLQNRLSSLVSFWCIIEAPVCLDELVWLDHILISVLFFLVCSYRGFPLLLIN